MSLIFISSNFTHHNFSAWMQRYLLLHICVLLSYNVCKKNIFLQLKQEIKPTNDEKVLIFIIFLPVATLRHLLSASLIPTLFHTIALMTMICCHCSFLLSLLPCTTTTTTTLLQAAGKSIGSENRHIKNNNRAPPD